MSEVIKVAKVLGRGESVKLGGADFYVRPFRFGQIDPVIELFERLAGMMEQHGSKLVNVEGEGDDAETSINIVEAFKVGSSVVFDIIKLALEGQEHKFLLTDIETGEALPDAKPATFEAFFAREVDVEQGLALCNTIWTINKDFFVQRVLPEMNKLLNSIGSTFAVGSSPTDTPSETSPITT